MDVVGVIGAVVGVGALLVSIYTSKYSARKDRVEALIVIIDALQEENDRLSAKVDKLEQELTAAQEKIAGLERDNKELKEINQIMRERELMRKQCGRKQ